MNEFDYECAIGENIHYISKEFPTEPYKSLDLGKNIILFYNKTYEYMIYIEIMIKDILIEEFAVDIRGYRVQSCDIKYKITDNVYKYINDSLRNEISQQIKKKEEHQKLIQQQIDDFCNEFK